MSFATKTVRVRTGIEVPYVEHGDATGVPMILLHGYTDSWTSFERVLPHLPGHVRAWAPTQRGHGDATRPKTGYRTRDFAADVAAFIEALGIGPAIVVGHSMGSTNALRLTIDHPELVRGLVLAASFGSYRRNPVVMEFWESGVSRLTDPIDPAFVREFQQGTLARPLPAAFIDAVVKESLKVPAWIWREAFEGFLEDDVLADLHRVAAPTLILWGDRDTLCSRADEDFLLATIRGSRLVAYEGAGHALHWEEPERFARDLAAFCEELTPRG